MTDRRQVISKRQHIIEIIKRGGASDLKHIHDQVGGNLSGLRQLIMRMVKEGQLARFPLAPRTYYTTDLAHH